MADIFISYSKADRPLTEQLAKELQAKGYSVWWDTELVSGESFRTVILAELAKARAVIVVWTPAAVKSDWVVSEADRAKERRILIQVRRADVAPKDLPPPFDVLHTALVTDRGAIYAALTKLGVVPATAPPVPSPEPPRPPRRTILIGAGAVAAVGVAGSLVYIFSPPRPQPQPPGSTPAPPQAPAPDWLSYPKGTRLKNMSADAISTFVAPDRQAKRRADIRPWTTFPPAGMDVLLAHGTVQGEPWLRFDLLGGGDELGRYGYVPKGSLEIVEPG